MSKTSTNTAAVPEAKGALDRFKFEVANELGVPLSDGYNGNLTSKQNGSVGGYMAVSYTHLVKPRCLLVCVCGAAEESSREMCIRDREMR